MPQKIKKIFISLCIAFFSKIALADPWFTGPILAAAGHTIPNGHSNFEMYVFDKFTNGKYDRTGRLIPTPLFKSIIPLPLLTHGFTDWLDVQLGVPYVFSTTKEISNDRLADVSVGVGLQLIEHKKHKYLPDVRLFIQETFPTGKSSELNPLLLGADSTGLGSYATLVSLNFQYLAHISDDHYLRTRLILSYIFYSNVQLMGLNSFGGNALTAGTAKLGTDDTIDLAFEYTLNQNWVAVMEGYYSDGTPVTFNGIFTGPRKVKNLTIVDRFSEIGLAPAIEYNFNSNVGLIGGVWFDVAGTTTSHYLTYVLALNAYW